MIRKTNRETPLEKRITRLENMIKNERRTRKFEGAMIGDEYKRGARVVDADGTEGTIVAAGTLAGIWRWNTKVDNRNEIRMAIDEDDNIWQAWTVVVDFDNGDRAMVVYPDETLDLI